MAGEKAGGGWRSRFGKKSHAGDGSVGGDPLAEMMNIERKPSGDNLRQMGGKREGSRSTLRMFDDDREMAAQHIARQQRAANDGRAGNGSGILNRSGSGSASFRLDEYRSSGRGTSGGVGGTSQGTSKLERLMGGKGMVTDYARPQPQYNRSISDGADPSPLFPLNSSPSPSDATSKAHIDTDETSCPVCLELLSFRLAGEKPHVTPICGHALHHACFTAVYGPPEAILAAQNSSGRAPPPGMCGVCRKLIVIGDESESRRNNKLAGMMGVADSGSRHASPGTMRAQSDLQSDSSKAGDDPLEAASLHRSRARDGLRDANGYSAGIASSTDGGSNNTTMGPFSPSLSNEDSLSQSSSRGMLYPTIKVRPEYNTVYRKERKADQSKQNVVCVVSVEVPPRRMGSGGEEEERLWMQKTGSQRALATIEDDGDDEYAREEGEAWDDEQQGEMANRSELAEAGERVTADRRESAMSEEEEEEEEEEGEEEGFSFGATPAATSVGKTDPFATVVDDLRRRITDWKGHTVDRFGPLILYDFLGVRQENVVREFYVYLFKEALLCVTEEKKKEKGLARLMGSDKNANGGHHFEELHQSSGSSSGNSNRHNKPALKLKGRIWLRHIRKCQETEATEGQGYCLSIKLEDESLDQFVLCLKDQGHRAVWKEKMEELLKQHQRSKKGSGGAPVNGVSSGKGTMQEVYSPGAPLPDVFEDAKAQQSINRWHPTPSNSGHSLQSGKSGSNNLASPGSTFASPRASQGFNTVSPASHRGMEQGKPLDSLRSSNHSSIPGLPSHQQWSSSGGLDPTQSPPDLLPHTPIDLVIMVSVPTVDRQAGTAAGTKSSSAALKLRLIRSTLDFVINHLGTNDRIALVAYNVGLDGLVRRTSLLNPSKSQSKERLERFVETIGQVWNGPGEDPFQEDVDRLGGSSDRTDTVTAVNIGFDVVLQRKSKNPVTGMILINDTADAPRRGQMDLVMARAEAANVPVHCFGFGKSHDPSSLWLISNHTRGTYTFVKEWYQLRECVTGCIGSMMSVALTEVKLHISVPSDNHFKVRKVAGPSGAIISSSGKDVDIELGEMRFGDSKELFVELELDFYSLMTSIRRVSGGRQDSLASRKGITEHYEKGSATDDFMQRIGLQGLSISHEEKISPHNSYDQASMEGAFIEEVAVLEVDCGCKDPSLGSSTNRLPNPAVLTLEVDGTSTDPMAEISAGSGGAATALADPVVTRRRLEILVSDMITRCLLLVSKRNHSQALTILLETRRIVDTVLQAIPVDLHEGGQAGGSRHSHMHLPHANSRSSQAKKQRDVAHRKTALSLLAILDDLDVLIDGLEANQIASFERTERNFGAQQAMALRDQKAWTSRTDTEWQFHRNIDNAAPFAALAASLAVSGRSR